MTPSLTAPAAADAPSIGDARYRDVRSAYSAALARLAKGYERDPHARRDLLQEIHVALWQSLAIFDGRCSLRTWVYRVAHNVATAHLLRSRRQRMSELTDLEALEHLTDGRDVAADADTRQRLERLLALVQRLVPLERQLMLLYLEGVDAAEIAEIVGMTPTNVATRIHRIKRVLRRQFDSGESDGKR